MSKIIDLDLHLFIDYSKTLSKTKLIKNEHISNNQKIELIERTAKQMNICVFSKKYFNKIFFSCKNTSQCNFSCKICKFDNLKKFRELYENDKKNNTN